jgi:hypothetical protein
MHIEPCIRHFWQLRHRIIDAYCGAVAVAMLTIA